MGNLSFNGTLILLVLNALFGIARAETPAVSQQVDCFQKICLSLPVAAEQQIRAGTEIHLLQIKIAVLMDPESEYLHA
jgi:hypothetical protein